MYKWLLRHNLLINEVWFLKAWGCHDFYQGSNQFSIWEVREFAHTLTLNPFKTDLQISLECPEYKENYWHLVYFFHFSNFDFSQIKRGEAYPQFLSHFCWRPYLQNSVHWMPYRRFELFTMKDLLLIMHYKTLQWGNIYQIPLNSKLNLYYSRIHILNLEYSHVLHRTA